MCQWFPVFVAMGNMKLLLWSWFYHLTAKLDSFSRFILLIFNLFNKFFLCCSESQWLCREHSLYNTCHCTDHTLCEQTWLLLPRRVPILQISTKLAGKTRRRWIGYGWQHSCGAAKLSACAALAEFRISKLEWSGYLNRSTCSNILQQKVHNQIVLLPQTR